MQRKKCVKKLCANLVQDNYQRNLKNLKEKRKIQSIKKRDLQNCAWNFMSELNRNWFLWAVKKKYCFSIVSHAYTKKKTKKKKKT